MSDTKSLTVYQLSLPAGFLIVVLNPIELLNENFRQAFSSSYILCFQYHQMCNIDTYAELVGSALPFSILTYFILLIFSDKTNRLKGFIVLLIAYSLAHALHV